MTDAIQYTHLIRKPAPESINSGLSPMSTRRLIEIFGHPRKAKDYTDRCQLPNNKKLLKHITLQGVGPFRVTGFDLAVSSLADAFAELKQVDPKLYALLGTAGMLCVRKVRGSELLSNHSFGMAVDLTVGGKLDVRGDNKVQAGLLALYPIMHKHGWYWGAEYRTEDAMHYELSWEKFERLYRGLED